MNVCFKKKNPQEKGKENKLSMALMVSQCILLQMTFMAKDRQLDKFLAA